MTEKINIEDSTDMNEEITKILHSEEKQILEIMKNSNLSEAEKKTAIKDLMAENLKETIRDSKIEEYLTDEYMDNFFNNISEMMNSAKETNMNEDDINQNLSEQANQGSGTGLGLPGVVPLLSGISSLAVGAYNKAMNLGTTKAETLAKENHSDIDALNKLVDKYDNSDDPEKKENIKKYIGKRLVRLKNSTEDLKEKGNPVKSARMLKNPAKGPAFRENLKNTSKTMESIISKMKKHRELEECAKQAEAIQKNLEKLIQAIAQFFQNLLGLKASKKGNTPAPLRASA